MQDTRDAVDVAGCLRIRVAYREKRLPPDRVAHAWIPADDAEQRRGPAKEIGARPRERGIGSLTATDAASLVLDDARGFVVGRDKGVDAGRRDGLCASSETGIWRLAVGLRP